jgi:hypothetical protein
MPRRTPSFAAVAIGAMALACASSGESPGAQAAPEETTMAPIVENWALVEGRVEAFQPADAAAQARLTLRVDRQSSVERIPGALYPNFLEGREGSTIVISVPEPAAATLADSVGRAVRLRVRRGGRQDAYFAHPEGVVIQ